MHTNNFCNVWPDVVATCGILVLCLIQAVAGLGVNCSSASECGWQAQCLSGVCGCAFGFTLHNNRRDCGNDTCTITDCLQCSSQTTCIKCVSFIAKTTGQCLQRCKGSAEMKGDSLVCSESEDEDDDDDDQIIIIAVVGGIAAGTLLCIIIIIIVCIYIRRTRRNIDLQSKSYAGRHMDSGNVKKFSVYDNNAFENDFSGLDYRLSKKMDPLEYQTELERLRPHMDTLMTLLSQTRGKTRAMKEGDPRLPTYKGVIHQLCRVLVLLHKKDPIQNLPSDALSLVQWGHQMVEDSRQQEMSSSDAVIEFPTAQISSVDLDMEAPHPISPVYATPDGSTDQGFALPTLGPGQATPYSSVPVPYGQVQQEPGYATTNNHTAARKPGFATISRTPSIPNGALLQNLEFSHPREETVTSFDHPEPAQLQTPQSDNDQHNSSQEVVRLRREEFRNFLITNRDSPSAQPQVSRVDDLEGETVITGGDGEDLDHGSQGLNDEVEEENKFNTFGRSNKLNHIEDTDTPVLRNHKTNPRTLPRPLSTPNFGLGTEQYYSGGDQGSPIVQNFHPVFSKRPVSQTYSIPQKQHHCQPLSTSKKNIITNPNAIKSTSFSSLSGKGGKKSQEPVLPATGYFANGRFYDPNPMPGDVVDGEVYAPGSNYSDRSNVMSTFLGDLPRSRSASSSNHSEGDDSENSGGDLDVFPFDPNDATDPVEV
ncbi:hypothetical protein PoB_006464800 [Plakobranchus ocellatus]|uniref:Uncharacterized protein n=1 Tax=Plakobranchus ocellatus TaxID=259542 RepID=A0AAV4D1V7_9GAST|nr:hypothetical protein PoB_006464800 [Plakobranchus ocellatus]